MKGKKIIIAITAAVLVLLVVAFLNLNGGNQEEKLTKRLETVGTEFYTEFYYDQISAGKTEEEVSEFLTRFVELGIKVDIDNLSRFNEDKYANIVEEFHNKKDNVACDIRNTKAIIYPVAPFGKTDFTVSSVLDCGFETVEEE